MKYFLLIFSSLIMSLCFTSCASMQVQGNNPIQRATSAADLLLEGKTSDSYIKVYKEELGKAEITIKTTLERARHDETVYADIADNVAGWISLYNRIDILKNRYTDGLQGKKEFIQFVTIDYTDLKEDTPIKATEALYAKALKIDTDSSGNIEKRLTALEYLQRAKKYSAHLNTKINALGADICYTAAETLSLSNNPENLMYAANLYTQSYNWIPNYKNALQKVPALKQRAASLYITDGNAKLTLENYTSFRQAKDVFTKAENIVPGIAASQLKTVNNLLTRNLVISSSYYTTYPDGQTVIFFDGTYPDELAVTQALQNQIKHSTYGPARLEVRFEPTKSEYRTGYFNLFFSDFSDNEIEFDLILVTSDDFGFVEEVYGAVHTNRQNVSKTIGETVYTGTVIEQSQPVTVFFNNTVTLYEYRENEIEIEALKTFNEEFQKTTKTFTARIYEGDKEAKPESFDAGGLYIPGQYKTFFSDFYKDTDTFAPITQSFGTLNDVGQEICRFIVNLPYRK